jgi:hypothetical protein
MKLMLKPALLSLLVCCTLGTVAAPPGKISDNMRRHYRVTENEFKGTVLDDQNNPLPGATIKNSATGFETKSNNWGKFVLTANIGDTIVLSLQKYKSLKYVLGAEKDFSVSLEADQSSLAPTKALVVQQIYNTVPQDLAVSSNGAVYNNDLIKSPVTSFQNALSGIYFTIVWAAGL